MQNTNQKIIIAIDGFSSCGKSTFAKAIAKRLGYIFIDTGSMYRAIALAGYRRGAIKDGVVDRARMVELLPSVEISFKYNQQKEASDLYLGGEYIDNDLLRSAAVNGVVSEISSIGEVRTKLVAQQQEIGHRGGVVMDGRDIGSVVFPEAQIKIFMTTDASIRARRRYDELKGGQNEASYESILKSIENRDKNDMERSISPLVQAPDAVVLDNGAMSVEQQLEWFEELFTKRI
ncbi:MAG: (d)CMP kinase [Rikenellaceae bacterium]